MLVSLMPIGPRVDNQATAPMAVLRHSNVLVQLRMSKAEMEDPDNFNDTTGNTSQIGRNETDNPTTIARSTATASAAIRWPVIPLDAQLDVDGVDGLRGQSS